DRKLRAFDLLHLLPAFIYIIDFFPVIFLTSIEEKKALIQSEIYNPDLFTSFSQSYFFPYNFHTYFRLILILGYWSITTYKLFQFNKERRKNNFARTWVWWMQIYLLLLLLMFLPYIISIPFFQDQYRFDLIHTTGAILLLFSGVSILFFPRVLYGLNEFNYYMEKLDGTEPQKSNPHVLTNEKIEFIRDGLHRVLELNKAFLTKGYALSDLAGDVKVPSYILTLYINKYLNTTFSDLINKNRIDEICRRFDSGDYHYFTLESLAEMCGFNNRNSFAIAFKKFKETTPSQYIKKLQSDYVANQSDCNK
ncbi:MAG: helix-turn-helix domain-containing protein, partial [Ignavibacterium sp.]